MSATQHLFEVFTRHQIFVQRRAGGTVNDVLPIFDRMLKDINAQIAQQPATESARRLARLSRSIEAIVLDATTEFSTESIEQVEDFAVYESGFTERAIGDVVTLETVIPTPEQVLSTLSSTPSRLVSGDSVLSMTLDDMFEDFSEKKPGEISRVVQAGFIQGQTTAEITRTVSALVDNRTKRQAETLVRTATNHAASIARQKTISENSDVIDSVRWVSTLDTRTSNVCMGRDQNVYNIEPGPESPRPPAHFGCRSTVVPVIDDEFAIPGLGGERASISGPVSTRTTYNSFLKRQSKEFQVEVLGVDRAKLFRSGGLSVDKFTDDDGITYTLEELKELEPMAFERAGLEE
jgi:SPP1 gp7 family putative phage head morphogenesis protein